MRGPQRGSRVGVLVAGLTGLEPATSDVTGRRSNQLNYNPALTAPGNRWAAATVTVLPGPERLAAEPAECPRWWAVQDSNL